jgi:hypothetical protein
MSVLDSVLNDLRKMNVVMRQSVAMTETQAVTRSMVMSVSTCAGVKPMIDSVECRISHSKTGA